MRILVLNGPNLNLLGIREPALYGTGTYADLTTRVTAHAAACGMEAECRQTNHEGVLVDWIQQARGVFDGIVINAAAYTHTSVAILDALNAVGLPAVEVHLTDTAQREDFRHVSYLRAACFATVQGLGPAGYERALDLLAEHLKGQQ